MEAVFRALAIYVGLLILMRISGRRTFAQLTAFDFVLLLVIGEATQQALLGEDFSITNAAIVVGTLIFLDIFLSLLKGRFPKLAKIVEGQPTLIMSEGQLLEDRMKLARVDRGDILTAAREQHGIGSLDKIRFAVLEKSGGISIIPKE